MGILIKKYLWVLTLIGIAFCSYFLAKITNTLIADRLIVERKFTFSPSPFTSPSSKAITSVDVYKKTILERNMFDSRDIQSPIAETTESTPETSVNPEGVAVKTNLPIKLLSTFSVGGGIDQRSTATIQNSSSGGVIDVYTVGDNKQFAPSTKITKILSNRVEFINGNKLEYVEIENLTGLLNSSGPSNPPEKTPQNLKDGVVKEGKNKIIVDRAKIDSALDPANLPRLLQQANATTHFVGNKPAGIKLLAVASGSLFSELDLQRGDVLERINGLDLDMTKALELLNQLKTQNNITLDLIRNGQKQTIEYEIR